MSQGNNFLFIYLQMPSRIRIQPVHLLSQKPCGSSQPVLDVTACSCPGWLLAQGQPQREDILTWLFRELEMLHVGLDLLTSLFPNAQHWSLSKAGAASIRPLGWPCMAIHIFFLFYFPLRQCQVLMQCRVTDPSRTHYTEPPTSELASSDPLLSHLCSSPPCLTDRQNQLS